MTNKQRTGKIGEALAKQHLISLGLTIVAESFRHGRVEIDLIARRPDGCLIFVEVKARRGLGYGHPSGAVSVVKEKKIAKAAGAFMQKINHQWEVRFDIISVLLAKDGSYELEHLEDAFFPGLF